MFETWNFETWHIFAFLVYFAISYQLGIEGLVRLFFREESSDTLLTMTEKSEDVKKGQREDVKKGIRDIWNNQSILVAFLAIALFTSIGTIIFFFSLIPASVLKKINIS